MIFVYLVLYGVPMEVVKVIMQKMADSGGSRFPVPFRGPAIQVINGTRARKAELTRRRRAEAHQHVKQICRRNTVKDAA